LPAESIRIRSVGSCEPSADVANTNLPGISFAPAVPSTLDVIKQYVTPDGSVPTYFMHLGGIREKDVEPVKKQAASWSNQKKPDPKVGPAKFVSATSRQSKHGPQFKFGVNPTSTYNTPFGIYAFPLTQEIFSQLKDGTLPFAQNEPYILIFKPAENLPLIYTSQDIPDDEFAEYVEKLFSDEFLDPEFASREAKIKSYRAKHPSFAPLPAWIGQSTKWLQKGKEQRDAIPTREWNPSWFRNLELVRQSNWESRDYLASVKGVKSNSGYLWNLARKASGGDPFRWGSILRKIGIEGIVDDAGTRHIHPQEPVQAVFFAKRGAERNLELQEVIPNTHTSKKITRRRGVEKQREVRMLVKDLAKKLHPDPRYRVDAEVIENIIHQIIMQDDDWLLNPSAASDLTDTEEAVIELKSRGSAVLTAFFIRSYSKGSSLEVSNNMHAWEEYMYYDANYSSEAIDSHPVKKAHHKVLETLRDQGHYYVFDDPSIPEDMIMQDEVIKIMRNHIVEKFKEIDDIVEAHRKMTTENRPEAVNRQKSSDPSRDISTEDIVAPSLKALKDTKQKKLSEGLQFKGDRWKW